MAQLVEHILGKDEVPGPNPGSSSKTGGLCEKIAGFSFCRRKGTAKGTRRGRVPLFEKSGAKTLYKSTDSVQWEHCTESVVY